MKKTIFVRVKRAVDKIWSVDFTNVTDSNRTEEAVIQSRQRDQKNIDFAIRRFRPPHSSEEPMNGALRSPTKTGMIFRNI